jgi:hypothetical protein
MKPSEMLSRITTLLQAKVQLEEMKLENGTVIEADSFAEGESVFIITEDEKVPLPIGEYTMEDGKTIVVEEEGVIASLGEAKEEEEEMTEEELSADEVATGSQKTDEPKAEESEEAEAETEEEKSEELSEETPEDVELEHDDEHKDEMNQIVEAVVAAVSPMIEEMKEELGYVKDELGKMKNEELAKQEIEEQIKEELSETAGAKPIKHNPEAKPEVKMRRISQNKPTSTYDRVYNRLFNK